MSNNRSVFLMTYAALIPLQKSWFRIQDLLWFVKDWLIYTNPNLLFLVGKSQSLNFFEIPFQSKTIFLELYHVK